MVRIFFGELRQKALCVVTVFEPKQRFCVVQADACIISVLAFKLGSNAVEKVGCIFFLPLGMKYPALDNAALNSNIRFLCKAPFHPLQRLERLLSVCGTLFPGLSFTEVRQCLTECKIML